MLRLTAEGGETVPDTRLRAFDADCLDCREITFGDFPIASAPLCEPGENYSRAVRVADFRCPHCGSTVGVAGPFLIEVGEEEAAHA